MTEVQRIGKIPWLRAHPLIRLARASSLAAVAFTVGCAVPLGPGYRFDLRRSEVSEVSAQPPQIRVHISDTLQNVGNRDLLFLDLVLPVSTLPISGVSMSIDGRSAIPVVVVPNGESKVRVRFPMSWAPGETREIALDYQVLTAADSIWAGVGADGFYLADPQGFPEWSPPPGPFARGELRAVDSRLQTTVPSDWLVWGGRNDRRADLPGGLTAHNIAFRESGPPPFVIAGRFRQSSAKTARGNVIFWMAQALDPSTAQAAAERLSAAAAAFRNVFGPSASGMRDIRVVQMPGEAAPRNGETIVAPTVSSFPGGILVNREVLAQGLDSEPSMRDAESMLARTWLGWSVYPRPGSQLERSLAGFPIVLSATARGGAAARKRVVAELMDEYDSRLRATSGARPSPELTVSLLASSVAEDRASLFLVALEDLAGEDKFARAMRRIVQTMTGTDVGDEELRAALEAETGRDLAETFRTWLQQPTLPEDFRARYSQKR